MSDAVSTTGILIKRKPSTLPATVVVTSSSVAAQSLITMAAPHNLNFGDTIIIAGHTGSVPLLAGRYTVTEVVSPTTFTINETVTTGGTGGTAQREFQTIGELVSVTPPGFSRNKIETSTHNEGRESNVLGLLRQRDPAFRINYVGDNQTHIDLVDDILLDRRNRWMVALPSGVYFEADARVQQFNLADAPVDGAQQADCAITWAETVAFNVPA